MAHIIPEPESFMSKDKADTMAASPVSRNFSEINAQNISQLEKMKIKARQNPSVPIGVLGMIGMLGYQAHAFKNKGRMKTSVFLIQTRVRAQAMVVGAMVLGISYNLINDYIIKGKPINPTPTKERDDRKLKKSLSS